MILFLKIQDLDHSIEKIIDWLDHFEYKNYEIVNGLDFLLGSNDFAFTISSNQKHKSKTQINFADVNVVFYRGWLNTRSLFGSHYAELNSINENIYEIQNKISLELRRASGLVFNQLSKAIQIPKLSAGSVDKLDVLRKASAVGLNVPESLISNSRKEIKEFFYSNNELIITKPLYETTYYKFPSGMLGFKYNLVNKKMINSFDKNIFPSLFQQYLEKDIEIRSFYFFGKFYSMAIFSQLDKGTSIDFRNYNQSSPNRNVPFTIPNKIEVKLKELMDTLDLNTGSIDLIKTKDNNYYFLEVNPVGQFGMTSYPCNYNLEKKIALKLIELDN